ncbi:OmpH family outer membrane protein [Emticicia sp. 17c]|uniref:OmpH family outer membrane protein n=1 Tax=Emticicia sp. 17c TaxID=3127704 RepID=UPI00301BC69A
MKKIVLAITLTFVSYLSFSQTQKIGYVYDDYIMVNYHQVKALQTEVSNKRDELTKQLEEKNNAYQERYAQYQASLKSIENLTTESLNASLQEVKDLKKVMDDFQASAEAELQTLITTKYQVIRENVDAATKKVAAEKGYKIVFRRNVDASNRESTPVLLYANDNGRDNLSDAVLIKLGSTPPAKPQETTTPAKTAPSTAKKPTPKKQ